MILGISDIIFPVFININAFLIDKNIENSKNSCKSEQKNNNLTIKEGKTPEKNTNNVVA